MLINEAALVATLLDGLPLRDPVTVLDCGSGSRVDRTLVQPHIAAVFSGYSVTWTDARPSRGVVQVDWENANPEKFRLFVWPDVVTCLSLLEHVCRPVQTLWNVAACVGPGKCLIVSVPRSYPQHDCPTDNLWRPTAEELGDRVAETGLDVLGKYETAPERFGDVENASASVVLAQRPMD